MIKGRHCNRCDEEERQKLASISMAIRIRKERFALDQGKQLVEIRGKLADSNGDKTAHSLSTK